MSGVTTVSVSPAEAAAATAAATPAATVERPEYIPEKFWKGSVEESTKVMAASYAELEKKQSTATPAAEVTPAATPAAAPVEAAPAVSTDGAPAVSAEVESKLTSAAGSADVLKATLDWARVNATPEQKTLFDAALDTGNPALVEMAFAKIKGAYTEAMGEQGVRVSAASAPTISGAKPFGSQQEIVAFVTSPGYKSGDKAVHAEYESRMKVTNW
jgi:hypothetical protein